MHVSLESGVLDGSWMVAFCGANNRSLGGLPLLEIALADTAPPNHALRTMLLAIWQLTGATPGFVERNSHIDDRSLVRVDNPSVLVRHSSDRLNHASFFFDHVR